MSPPTHGIQKCTPNCIDDVLYHLCSLNTKTHGIYTPSLLLQNYSFACWYPQKSWRRNDDSWPYYHVCSWFAITSKYDATPLNTEETWQTVYTFHTLEIRCCLELEPIRHCEQSGRRKSAIVLHLDNCLVGFPESCFLSGYFALFLITGKEVECDQKGDF